jgi:homoserine O-acetyltransferase
MSGRDGWISIASPPPWSDGSVSNRVTLRYRSWGRLAATADNAVLVCPALTGDRRVDEWWPGLLGPGRALDPTSDYIVAVDVLGGCGGTGTEPQPSRLGVRDMVQAQRLVLEALRVERLRLVIGGSLGGMQALEWAVGHGDRIDSAAVIAAAPRQTAWAGALNHIQRRAIESHGDLELARMVAMLSYRHWRNLDDRFRPRAEGQPGVSGWLDHHGEALRQRFDDQAYLRLIDAMDRHDVGQDRGGWQAALRACEVPTLAVGITTDLLYPPGETRALAEALPQGHLAWLDAPQGHDAFLIEQAELNRQVVGFRRCLEQSALAEELSA